jgi:hypothetical protein
MTATFDKTIFISDTHGFFGAWTGLLQDLGLIDAEFNWIAGSKVRLIHVGDHTDRGEDSVGLYRLIKSYQTQLGPEQVVRLVGNHDLQYLGGPECGWENLIARELSEEMRQDVLDGTLKFAHEFEADDGSWLCVHAGLDAQWRDYHAMSITDAVEAINKAGVEYVENNGMSRKHRVIDGIGASRGGGGSWGPQGVTWCDYWMDLRTNEAAFMHRQIVGHTIQPRGVAVSPSGRFWGINVHYDHAQALVYDHATGEFEASAMLAPEGSPFTHNADAQVKYHVESLQMGGFHFSDAEIERLMAQSPSD